MRQQGWKLSMLFTKFHQPIDAVYFDNYDILTDLGKIDAMSFHCQVPVKPVPHDPIRAGPIVAEPFGLGNSKTDKHDLSSTNSSFRPAFPLLHLSAHYPLPLTCLPLPPLRHK